MRPVLLSLMMLVAATFAFDIGQYLYANETNASIGKDFFTLNHTVYYIVNISGKPTFLVETEDLVLDRAGIESVLKTYYASKYALNQNDTAALRTYFLAYNASRNDGGRFKGQEEFACRKAIFLPMYPCIDDASCMKTAKLVCAGYAQAIGCNDPNILFQPVKDFAYSSDATDALMADIFDKLNTITTDNTADYISQMKKDIPLLTTYKDKIEKSVFRMPAVGQSCKDCYAICPDMDFDDTSLTRAGSMLDNLSAKIAPLTQYKQTADAIYNSTQTRLQENVNANQRLYYLSLYTPLKAEAAQMKNRTSQALSLVDNATVRGKLNELTTMETEITALIDANNFSQVNASLTDYSRAISSLNSSSESLVAIYGNVSASYRQTTVYMFLAEGKTLSPDDATKLNIARQRKILLDQQFKAGLTATQYSDIQLQYEALTVDAKALASKISTEQALYMFTGMSNKFVDAIDSLFSQARPLTYSERAQLSGYLPPGVSALLFLSFASLVLFLFLIYYAVSPKPINKAVLVLLAMFLVFLVALVSLGIFLSLDKSLKRLEYSDFMDLVKYTKNAVVVVHESGAEDAATLSSMKACANSVSNALLQGRISSSVYEFGPSGCTVNGTSRPNCLDANAKPIIMLNSSLTGSSSYAGLLEKQALISGDRIYYDVCPLAEAIRMS